MDDIASYHQIETLRGLADERKKAGLPTPPPSIPKRSLVELSLECGFIDARWERRMLTGFEADLSRAVSEINSTF